MVRRAVSAAAALAFFVTILGAEGKYEEEAGKWDWHAEVFGGLNVVSFKANGKKAFFGAKGGLVGSVGMKGGAVGWRRLVGNGCDTVLSVVHSTSGSSVLAVCSNGVVNVFSGEGDLLWESRIDLGEGESIVGVSGQTEADWASIIVASADTVTIHPVVSEDGYKFGTPAATTIPPGADLTSAGVSDSSLYVAVGTTLHSLTLSTSEWSKSALPSDAWRVVATSADTVILRNLETGHCLENGVSREGGDVCTPGGALTYSTLFSEEETAAHGPVVAAFTHQSEAGPVAVLKFASGDTAGVLQGKVAWMRDDGLGDVTNAVPLNIDQEDAHDDHGFGMTSYMRLVRHQVEGVQDMVARLPDLIQEGIDVMSGNLVKKVHKANAVENQFELQRNFLLSSATTLFRVSSEDGDISFRRHIDAMLYPGTKKTGARIVKVMTSQASDGESFSPHVFVWARDAERDYVVSLFDHGKEPQVRKLDGHMIDGSVVRHFTFVDADDVQCEALVFTNAAGKVFTHPENAVSAGGSFHFFRISTEDGSLIGYKAAQDKATVSWRVHIHSTPGEEIVATSLHNFDHRKFTLTDNIKVQGNTSSGKTEVMSKYSNPNAVLIVTAVPARNTPQEDTPKREAYLVMYLVDGVTGSILNSMVQPNAVGPVHVVALEHMYLVHFFNTKRRRYQVTAMELFQDNDKLRGLSGDSTTNLKQIWTAMMGFPAKNVYSSFEVAPPLMIPTAFTFPVGAKALGVTVSELGVSSKQLVVALATDEIVSVDIQKHMDANAEKGISAVAWLPTNTISYHRTVVGADLIKTFPTKLESTSLMIVLGNDVFFSRVTSGKPFDMLNEDFGYAPLVLTVSATILVTLVTSILVGHNSQKVSWS